MCLAMTTERPPNRLDAAAPATIIALVKKWLNFQPVNRGFCEA